MAHARGRLLTAAVSVLAMTTAASLPAQTARAIVTGQVVLADDRPSPGAAVTLRTADGAPIATAITDASGRFAIADVAPGTYQVDAALDVFVASQALTVVTGAAPAVTLRLTLPTGPAIVVEGHADAFDRADATVSGDRLRALPARVLSRALPQALAAAPGWAEEDNGLLHVRGVDDGVLYVEDGIPVYDRVDVAFGIPPSRLIGEIKRELTAAVESGEIAPRLENEAYVAFVGDQKARFGIPNS